MIASQTATASLLTQFVQIKHDPFYVLSSVLLLSVFGISLEKRTTIGKALSAPLATMALALIVANLGLMPFSSPVYEFINRYLIPLAIPLLLYDSDLKRVITDTGSLFLAFILGALSTVIATICSYKLIPLSSLGEEGWKVGCALAARHIGGAINFVAVCETLNVGGSIVSAAIAADNVVVALYFAFLFYLAQPDDAATRSSSDNSEDKNARDIISKENITEEEIEQTGEEITMPSLAISIMVASCLATIGKIITKLMLPEGTSALPLISIVTVIGATLLPQFFRNLRTTGTSIGIIFLQMFLAASGASGSILLVMKSAPKLFIFSALQMCIHFITLMSVGKFIFRFRSKELYLASNANVGGPTTAAAMATAKGWKRLVLPALLVGILGYATATPIALALGPFLRRLY